MSVGYSLQELSPQEEFERLLVLEDADRLTKSLAEFAKAAWPLVEPTKVFDYNWHLDVLFAYLEHWYRGQLRGGTVKNLILNLAPGGMKSLSTSVFGPAWWWANDPSARFINLTNADTLAERDSVKMRNIIQSDWYQERWGHKYALTKEQSGKMYFTNTASGFRQGLGFQANITGRRGTCVTGDTQILTDLGYRTIQQIHEQQLSCYVLAYDFDNEEAVYAKVLSSRCLTTSKLIYVTTKSGNVLRLTDDHPVYVVGKGYTNAGSLEIGMPLLSPKGKDYIVSLGAVIVPNEPVYDIQVRGTSNFFAEGILVHNCLLIDDPIDAKKAFSDAEIESVNQTFDQVIGTRLDDVRTSGICIIMQRLRINDLTGHVLEKEPENWVHVKIPMRWTGKEGYDPVKDLGKDYKHLRDPRRRGGSVLYFPLRFPEKEVRIEQKRLGEYGTSGQHQQEPVPIGGGIIKKKWWVCWEDMHEWRNRNPKLKKRAPPLMKHVFWSWDTAFSEQDIKANAFTAGTKWGLFYDEAEEVDKLMLLGQWHGRVAFNVLKRRILDASKEDTDIHLIERKGSGISVIQELRRNRKIKVRSYDPKRDGGKKDRAMLCTSHFEGGLIVYPDREWANNVIDWVSSFPTGAPPSADITDTVTMAVLYIVRKQWIRHPDDDITPDIEDDYPDDIDDEHVLRRHGTYG